MGILNPPELTTLMEILTIPPAQLNDYDLLPLPLSLSLTIVSLSLSSHFCLFFSPLILFKLRSVPAVCHNDTISASRPPSLLPLYQLPLTLSLSLVCLISPDAFVDRERMLLPLSLFVAPTLSSPLSPLICACSTYPTISRWLLVSPSPPLLLSSFTPGYNVEIRLSVPFYFSVLLHCFGLSLSVSGSFLFVTLDTVLLFVY